MDRTLVKLLSAARVHFSLVHVICRSTPQQPSKHTTRPQRSGPNVNRVSEEIRIYARGRVGLRASRLARRIADEKPKSLFWASKRARLRIH